jgi:hypothetical protein
VAGLVVALREGFVIVFVGTLVGIFVGASGWSPLCIVPAAGLEVR